MKKLHGRGHCKHCNRWMYLQARGLCKKCYTTPEIKDQYPPAIVRPRKNKCRICKHCEREMYIRSRGLCGTCWVSPDIRYKYEPKHEKPPYNDFFGCLPLPPEPTEHLPFSPEKEAVLRWRDDNGFSLWHPDDAKPDLE